MSKNTPHRKTEQLQKVLSRIKNAKSFEAANKISSDIARWLISDPEGYEQVILDGNFYTKALLAMLDNTWFRSALSEIIGQEKEVPWEEKLKDKRPISGKVALIEKKYLYSMLRVGALPLSAVYPKIDHSQIQALRKYLPKSINEIRQQLQNYTSSELLLTLYHISINVDFNPMISIPQGAPSLPFFNYFATSIHLAGSMFLLVSQMAITSIAFSNSVKHIRDAEQGNTSISHEFANLYRPIYKVDSGINYFKRLYSRRPKISKQFNKFIDDFTHKNQKVMAFVIELITSKIVPQNPFAPMLLDKIQSARADRATMMKFANSELISFKDNASDELAAEWSNKLVFTSIKTLAALEAVAGAKNEDWKIKFAIREFVIWIQEINQILNRHNLDDDWDKIFKYLREENSETEWKSTLFTDIQQQDLADSEKVKITNSPIFVKTIETIVGMMNSDGGTIIIGHVERPEAIARSEFLENLMLKEGRHFLNILFELSLYDIDMDDLKRLIQDKLVIFTGRPISFCDNLWNMESLLIKEDDKVIQMIKISVKKSSYYFFTPRTENQRISISLIKRMNGRTEYVDPRDFIETSSVNPTLLEIEQLEKPSLNFLPGSKNVTTMSKIKKANRHC